MWSWLQTPYRSNIVNRIANSNRCVCTISSGAPSMATIIRSELQDHQSICITPYSHQVVKWDGIVDKMYNEWWWWRSVCHAYALLCYTIPIHSSFFLLHSLQLRIRTMLKLMQLSVQRICAKRSQKERREGQSERRNDRDETEWNRNVLKNRSEMQKKK